MYTAIVQHTTAGDGQHSERHRLHQEIAWLETRLAQIDAYDDSACEKALIRAYEKRLAEHRACVRGLERNLLGR